MIQLLPILLLLGGGYYLYDKFLGPDPNKDRKGAENTLDTDPNMQDAALMTTYFVDYRQNETAAKLKQIIALITKIRSEQRWDKFSTAYLQYASVSFTKEVERSTRMDTQAYRDILAAISQKSDQEIKAQKALTTWNKLDLAFVKPGTINLKYYIGNALQNDLINASSGVPYQYFDANKKLITEFLKGNDNYVGVVTGNESTITYYSGSKNRSVSMPSLQMVQKNGALVYFPKESLQFRKP